MSDSKTFVFPDSGNGGGNSVLAMLPALLQKQGVDPNILALTGSGRGGFGGDGLFGVLLLFILFGAFAGNGFGGFGGNRGFGGNGQGGVYPILNNDANTAVIMQSVQRNGFDIQTLATALNTSSDTVMAAINALGSQICNLGNQMGQNTNQIVTAIMQGNNSIISQLCNCCCDLKQAIAGINTGLERGFSSIAFETQRQTCDITKSIENSTAQILAGQRAAEMREMQREIAERDRKIAEQAVVINNGQQTAIFGQMITQAAAPIAQAVGALQNDVNGIKCKLPNTVPVPYPQLQAYNPEIYRAAAAGAFAGDVAFSRSGNGCSGYWG